jgi:hypothetical protein
VSAPLAGQAGPQDPVDLAVEGDVLAALHRPHRLHGLHVLGHALGRPVELGGEPLLDDALTWLPSPVTNRSPDSSLRSHACSAVTVGERGNASVMLVPTSMRSVACTATEAWMIDSCGPSRRPTPHRTLGLDLLGQAPRKAYGPPRRQGVEPSRQRVSSLQS